MVGSFVVGHPSEALSAAGEGARFGASCLVVGATGGSNFLGANDYVQAHQAEYGATTTTICMGAGVVAREALIMAATSGAGTVLRGGCAARKRGQVHLLPKESQLALSCPGRLGSSRGRGNK